MRQNQGVPTETGFCLYLHFPHNMMKRKLFFLRFFLITLLLLPPVQHTIAQREMSTINSGWTFAKGERPDKSEYMPVAIPHTWNTDAYTIKKYDRGIAWYQKTLPLPQQWKDKQLFLRFEAVSQVADVYVNGQQAGQHRGGYTAFTIDITPFCSFSTPNEITVRVDNARDDVPPISGDFTFFGGIYRDVWLITVPKQHFTLTNNGSDGIFISTPKVSEEEGTLTIQGTLRNNDAKRAELEIIHTLYAPDGSMVRNLRQTAQIAPGEDYTFSKSPALIRNPQLWSPESPNLYRVETQLRNRKTRQLLDQVSQYVGFRWYQFDGEKGFFLNGKPYKLNGICRHQDQKPIGVALSDEMHRRDMLLMKEMGANFIRISHYPQDPAIIEQCDKLGMLAWEEIPVIDIVPDSEEYANTCEQNLREMIRQHYNHPSIITWGYMNEILLVTQRLYRTPEKQKPVLERTLALAHRLEKVLKEEDPYRSSTMAFHGSDSYNTTGLGTITDVVGWNLYQGWYGGELKGFERFLKDQHRKHPSHPMIVSEYGAGSDRRLHSFNPKSFDFSIEYQQKYLEHYLPVITNTPYICGGTHWNFIDFSAALRDESIPRINNKGLVYSDRTPKDVFYYYKAMFRKDIPVLHIASRDWTNRAGIRQQGAVATIQPVKVYTNLSEVEFFLNGLSLGTKKSENCTVTFDVPFQSGKQILRATNGNTEDAVEVRFTTIPARLTKENIEGVELAINVGSDCFYTSDESHLTWVPDQPYTSESWGYMAHEVNHTEGNQVESTQTEIMLTNDNPLYQTARSELAGYRFDVPNGTYELELLFADILQSSETIPYLLGGGEGGSSSLGNAFQILINGQQVEEACSPSAENGSFRAVKKRFIVPAKDHKIEVRLKTLHGKNFLNGIKLRKL